MAVPEVSLKCHPPWGKSPKLLCRNWPRFLMFLWHKPLTWLVEQGWTNLWSVVCWKNGHVGWHCFTLLVTLPFCWLIQGSIPISCRFFISPFSDMSPVLVGYVSKMFFVALSENQGTQETIGESPENAYEHGQITSSWLVASHSIPWNHNFQCLFWCFLKLQFPMVQSPFVVDIVVETAPPGVAVMFLMDWEAAQSAAVDQRRLAPSSHKWWITLWASMLIGAKVFFFGVVQNVWKP